MASGYSGASAPRTKTMVKKATVKVPVKKKVVVMPDTINPFKMTPAQKAEYLKNAKRYDK